MHFAGLLFSLAAFAGLSSAINFAVEYGPDYNSGRGKCVSHRIPGHSLVTGFFRDGSAAATAAGTTAPNNPNARVTVLVYDSLGNQPFSRPDLTGEARFSFRSTDTPNEYDFCVRVAPKPGVPLPTGTQIPIEVVVKFDYDLFDEQRAHDFKLKPIETEFIQLEEVMRRVASELSDMVVNEAAIRTANESTFERVSLFSVLSILVLVLLGVYQIFYLKRFFKAKKLI